MLNDNFISFLNDKVDDLDVEKIRSNFKENYYNSNFLLADITTLNDILLEFNFKNYYYLSFLKNLEFRLSESKRNLLIATENNFSLLSKPKDGEYNFYTYKNDKENQFIYNVVFSYLQSPFIDFQNQGGLYLKIKEFNRISFLSEELFFSRIDLNDDLKNQIFNNINYHLLVLSLALNYKFVDQNYIKKISNRIYKLNF
jgi:hypothetical protein